MLTGVATVVAPGTATPVGIAGPEYAVALLRAGTVWLAPSLKSGVVIVTVSVWPRAPRSSVTTVLPSAPDTVDPVTLSAPPVRVAVPAGAVSDSAPPVRSNVTGVLPLVAAVAATGTKAARPVVIAAATARAR